MLRRTTIWLTLVFAFLLFQGLNDIQAQSRSSEEALKLVAMLDCNYGGDRNVIGAGIIFGSERGDLYIATANHVVRRGGNEAETIQVRFRHDPSIQLNAALLEEYDEELDLAVLVIDSAQVYLELADALSYNRLGRPNLLKDGNGLHAVGQPGGADWDFNRSPYSFKQFSGNDIEFEGTDIQVGNSGGGLFTTKWHLVGMVKRESTESTSRATHIESITRKLVDWGFKVDLELAPRRLPLAWVIGGGAALLGGGTAVILLSGGGGDKDLIPLPIGRPN